MTQPADFQRTALITDLAGAVRRRLGETMAGPAQRLAGYYLAGLSADDLAALDGDALFAVVSGLLGFIRQRAAGQAHIRVYDPEPDRHGWTSAHTVVEIVNDDMPFLVDSLSMVLARAGLQTHLLVHPVIAVRRAEDGFLHDVLAVEDQTQGQPESLIHVEIDRLSPDAQADLARQLDDTLEQVRLVVEDWPAMRARIGAVAAGLGRDTEETVENADFLTWLHDDHFTFLGYRHFSLTPSNPPQISTDMGDSLGLMRRDQAHVFDHVLALSEMPPDIRAFLSGRQTLLVTKSALHSTVHRPVHMDVVGVKQVDDQGRVVGLHAFVGLFTSVAYTRTPADIPLLRRKVALVRARTGFIPHGHDAKAMTNILDTYPRDELFQISDDLLYQHALTILHGQERPQVMLLVRRDEFERFVTCLVYLPRDRYDTGLRLGVIHLLEQAWGGHLDTYYTQVSDGPLARLMVVIRTNPGQVPRVDETQLEMRLAEAAKSWGDRMQAALVQAHGEAKGLELARRWCDGFPASYRELYPPLTALGDIARLEAARAGADLGLSFYRPLDAAATEARLKLVHPGTTIALSDILPVLEALGLRAIAEIPHEIRAANHAAPIWIHDFQLVATDGKAIDLAARRVDFEETVLRVWRGEADNDGFNRLVLSAGLSWRQAWVMRAYARYSLQAGSPLSQAYMEQALAANPEQTAALWALFRARFDPSAPAEGWEKADDAAEKSLDQVVNADDDRILRRFLGLIRATLRTNYFQDRLYLSLKLDSRRIDDLPLPRPMVEIFVHSPRMEGIHLRGGKVARGGIRWSDRREDFRTEILGLMKAQMVKNAVIVPVGAKGGFIVRRPAAMGGRDALLAEGIACYQTLIRGLLDVTDNLSDGKVVVPDRVIRHDGDDAYLVVAADKGTASFSDIANALSLERGFWLGDAFASGGSKGYDHKAMGITARGAWEAVKRHFREAGQDCQSSDFTVVGVGDMSGDVFGNAMLCSPHIRLVAAFNHSHIFIDPDPDPDRSFAERERLFKAVKSWPDYDPALISPGGGVFSRAAKSIPVSTEMAALLGISAGHMDPTRLIRILLTLPVDLLFFGGIGTYLKSSKESNAQAGDRANDALRVDGRDVQARIIGEGANLGMTQQGRIEYAQIGAGGGGGRINTDAIDNSAGVDTSDHEVNIKILLDGLVAQGELTPRQREDVLAAMTGEVAALVLTDNYRQTQALTVMQAQGAGMLDSHARFMRMLEKAGRLDRGVEFLPDDEQLAERAVRRQGLTRPELAVLLGYAKLWLHDAILASDLPDDPHLAADLASYFPSPIRTRFPAAISGHRLRREIIATAVTNSIINRAGISFIADMVEKTGRSPAQVARAYLIARDGHGLRAAWAAIENLDGMVPAAVQAGMVVESDRLLDRTTAWVLRSMPADMSIGVAIAQLDPMVAALKTAMAQVLPSGLRTMLAERQATLSAQGVPTDVASHLVGLIVLASSADIGRIAATHQAGMERAAKIYFGVGQRFSLGWLRQAAHALAGASHWQKQAAQAVLDDLYDHQRFITDHVMATMAAHPDDAALAAWEQTHGDWVARTDAVLADIRAAHQVDLAMLSVINRTLRMPDSTHSTLDRCP